MADLFDDPPPDFNARAFENIRNAIVDREGGDHNQAAQRLLAAWQADNERQADQREQDDQRPRAPQEEQQGEDQPAPDAQQANDPPAEGAPNPDKKKAKMADFAEGQAPPDIICQCPSQYAIQKLYTYDFVELWYFTQEGCKDAAITHCTNTEDAFGVTNSNDVLTLHPITSVKASKHAIPNEDLLFSQLMQAHILFMEYAQQVGWPEKHIKALVVFFWKLKTHSKHEDHNGDCTIINYAATVRRQWHDKLKASCGRAFDILVINESLMNLIHLQIGSADYQQLANTVSRSWTTIPICM